MADICSDRDPASCLQEAFAAYHQPKGYLIITMQEPGGKVRTESYARTPGDAGLVLPIGSILEINPDDSPYSFFSPAHAAVAVAHWLHLRRWRRALRADLTKADAADIPAWRRVSRTIEDYLRLRNGRAPSPIKGNADHLALLLIGRLYGIDGLTAEELAECFDEICLCNRHHSADALKRLRAQLRKLQPRNAGERSQRSRQQSSVAPPA